ncbi:MAG: alpha/beta hydrolase [bacterium]
MKFLCKRFDTKLTMLAKLKTAALYTAARAGNAVYTAASVLQRGRLKKFAAQKPKSLITPPEEIEKQTAARLVPTLQHTIYDLTEKKRVVPLDRLDTIVKQGLANDLFENFGEAIYIKQTRVADLLERLDLPLELEDRFIELATKHGLIREHIYANQLREALFLKHRQRGLNKYGERTYTVVTRDGFHLRLTRLVNFEKVRVGDTSPNILFIPGTACNELFFDLNDEQSLTLDTADKGAWVYSCAHRGLGRNKGEFDPHCTIDTEVSNELPAYIDYIFHRSKNKQVILIGHSKGGFTALFMAIRQAYKLQKLINNITAKQQLPNFSLQGKTRKEINQYLTELGNAEEIRSLIEEAKKHLEILEMIKGIITLGSPLAFDKNSHPIFPLFLTLNILLPTFGEEAVPVDKGKWLAKTFPSLAKLAKMLINPNNFDDPKAFIGELAQKATDSFPLGVGFQMLKAIHSGRGIRRMTKDKFEYAKHLHLIPTDIPIAMLFGDRDILAPKFNLGFIDESFRKDSAIDFSQFSRFQHTRQVVHRIASPEDVAQVPLPAEFSRVTGFLIEGINHLDFFYGKVGEETVRPLLNRLIDSMWGRFKNRVSRLYII